MTFNKPDNISYTEMSKTFDKEFWQETRDDNKLYSYLYHLYYMLSCKKSYFHKFEDYDGYSIFCATTIYMRFLKKLKNGEKIKSVLNYAKKTAYPLKVMYQNENYQEVINPEVGNIPFDAEMYASGIKDGIRDDYRVELEIALKDTFFELPRIIRSVINDTPYKDDKIMVHNLYVSCLLNFINSITHTNKVNKSTKQSTQTSTDILYSQTYRLYSEDRYSNIILWKLSDDMKDYVSLLMNKVRDKFAREILDTKNEFDLDDDVLSAIAFSSYQMSNNDEGDVM